MNDTVQTMMRQATRLTQAGHLREATQLIQRALSGSPVPSAAVEPREQASTQDHATNSAANDAPTLDATPLVLDGIVLTRSIHASEANAARNGPGEFIGRSHTHAGLTRRYQLFVPPEHAGRALPLVVMLHGCTQNPDDFAAGTGMSERALVQGFFVLYPAQSQDASPQRCWNWFKRNHQLRGSGEPALLADMTQAVMAEYGIDARRVYIAGLSAGGAMAHIVATAYPEIFAAVGVHSGLPRGAASNVPEAFAVMKSGTSGRNKNAKTSGVGISPATAAPVTAPVPTIVFHGDHDQTVHPDNGEQVIAALLNGVAADAGEDDPAKRAANPKVEQGLASGGRRYTRLIHTTGVGEVLAEHWSVHGAGHAWSGGSPKGSYTDARGPDATGEMLRFFFEHPHTTRC